MPTFWIVSLWVTVLVLTEISLVNLVFCMTMLLDDQIVILCRVKLQFYELPGGRSPPKRSGSQIVWLDLCQLVQLKTAETRKQQGSMFGYSMLCGKMLTRSFKGEAKDVFVQILKPSQFIIHDCEPYGTNSKPATQP